MEKETFEEFVSKDGYHDKASNDIWTIGVEDGIRWWQDRSYTEEEVLELLDKRLQSVGIKPNKKVTKHWFRSYSKII
jgi:hypothetical protein